MRTLNPLLFISTRRLLMSSMWRSVRPSEDIPSHIVTDHQPNRKCWEMSQAADHPPQHLQLQFCQFVWKHTHQSPARDNFILQGSSFLSLPFGLLHLYWWNRHLHCVLTLLGGSFLAPVNMNMPSWRTCPTHTTSVGFRDIHMLPLALSINNPPQKLVKNKPERTTSSKSFQ